MELETNSSRTSTSLSPQETREGIQFQTKVKSQETYMVPRIHLWTKVLSMQVSRVEIKNTTSQYPVYVPRNHVYGTALA